MDYTKLSSVGIQKVTDSTKKEEILKALRKNRRIKDAQKKSRIKDSYEVLKKKIKDALEETETTEEAVTTAIDFINEDTPAEDVLKAVVETLADTIDRLSEGEEEIEEPVEEVVEETEEEIEDSKNEDPQGVETKVTDSKAEFNLVDKLERMKHRKKVLDLLKNKKSEDWEWAPDGEILYKGKKVGTAKDEDTIKKLLKVNACIAKVLGTEEYK